MAKKRFTLPVTLVMLTVFLLSVLCFAPTPIPAQAAAQVVIVSHSSYIDTYGFHRIVGEVQNVGDQSVNDVEISPTYYNAEDVVIGTSLNASGGVSLNVLYPGRKAPFGYTFLPDASQVDHYALAIADFTPYEWTMDRQTLNITSHSSSIVEGDMIISGEIEHMGDSSANLVKVVATCYNESGTVVQYRGLSNLSIGPHGTTTFEITVYENVPLIDSYVLTAESPFYSIIPEFNSLLLTMLVLSLISISFLLSKRKILQH